MNKQITKIQAFFYSLKLTENRGLVLAFTAIFSGLIFGAVITCFTENSLCNEIISLFLSFFTDFTDKSKMEAFSGIVLSGLTYFAALFISGSNIFGREILLIFTFIKAAGLTSIISALYCEYALRGFEYCILVFLPGKILMLFAMLFITKNCFDFSSKLRKGLQNEKEAVILKKAFTIKALASLIIMMLSWIIDFLCLLIFSGLFSFKK